MATGEDLGRGGPEWNDDGLPEVDVVIPDDISELDREVQAYRREQRRARRQRLLRRVFPGSRRLGPYGVLAPVVAGALVVTAIFGSVLSLLGPRSAAPPAASGSNGAPAVDPDDIGRPLPEARVEVDGVRNRLSDVRSAVVLTVPTRCGCADSIDALTSTARSSGVGVYLSGRHKQMQALAERSGAYPHVLDHAAGTLSEHYHPSGLSAVLVDREGKVTDIVHDLQDTEPLPESQLERLATPAP